MFGLSRKPETSFWEALLANDVDQMRELLQKHPQLVSARAPQKLCRRDPALVDQATPLHSAAARGHAQILKLLLLAGAEISAANAEGATALHEAASCGHVEVAELLLYRRAEVDARDKQRRTPLHCAGWAAHDEVAMLLLKHGARPDTEDSDGNTVLHSLAAGGCERSVQQVLEAQVEVDACNKVKQRTPLHLVVMHADHSVFQRVAPDRRNARARMERVAQLLISHGADVNAVDDGGNTPLDLFNYLQGDDENDPLVKLLRKHGGHWVRYHHRHEEAATQPPPSPSAPPPSRSKGQGGASAAAEPSVAAFDQPGHAASHESHGSMAGFGAAARGRGGFTGEPIALSEHAILIGRNPECDVRYHSRTLSRQHAQITCVRGEYIIKDLGSHNGVQINGRHLHAPHLLSPGEIITTGVYEFEFDGTHLIPLREELSEAELRAEMAR